jgi:hypothetical protein
VGDWKNILRVAALLGEEDGPQNKKRSVAP